MDDLTFDAKYNCVSKIFADWITPYIDIHKATIVDFGCGDGVIALGIALNLKPHKIIGIDINREHENLLRLAEGKIGIQSLPNNLEFYSIKPGEKLTLKFSCDCIFTWSVFEHVDRFYLNQVVIDMYQILKPDGLIFLQIAPLYYSAFGSHLEALIEKPWAHLLWQHNHLYHAAMTAKGKIISGNLVEETNDQNFEEFKKGTWSCYETLNKITADEVVELFESHGFETIKQYRSNCNHTPPENLKKIFFAQILLTEQIVVLFKKNEQGTEEPVSGSITNEIFKSRTTSHYAQLGRWFRKMGTRLLPR
jgi:SAM-dependent methyltransferase